MPSDDEIRAILSEAGTSQWLKNALTYALDRDPVDAANDAELLAIVLSERAKEIGKHAATAATSMAIHRAVRPNFP